MENLDIIERIEKMRNEGMSQADIANEIGLNRSEGVAFVHCLEKLKIISTTKRDITKEVLEKLNKDQNMTGQQIAQQIGCHKNTVYNIAKREGYALHGKNWNEGHQRKCHNLLKAIFPDYENHSIKEIEPYLIENKDTTGVKILTMFYDKQMTYREISLVFNCSWQWTRYVLYREERRIRHFVGVGETHPEFHGLSTRAYNILVRNGFKDLRDERLTNVEFVSSLYKCGKKTTEEIIKNAKCYQKQET